jgi:hypothetical protein
MVLLLMNTEHNNQCAYFRWVRIAYKDKVIFAVPNQRKQSARNGKWMKDEGVLAGIPDIIIASKSGVYHGMFIEMKSEKGKLSKSQKEIIDKLESEGYFVKVCYSWIEAKEETEKYFNVLA